MQVQITGIKKKYKNNPVLTDVTLQATSGSCIGILGSNGCGKSTLLSILGGILRPDGGSFLCDGKDLFKDPALRSELVGYVPQGTPLIEELSARDNLLLWYSPRQLEQEIKDGLLKLLGIDTFFNVPVYKMSGGMKKRLSIGCAVAKKPPVLLLDEPTAALDLACKQDIAAYLNSYKQKGGLLFLTTHDTLELALCDQWYILKDGVLVPFHYDGDLEALVKQLS